MVTDPGTSPYGVVVTPGGRWAFVSLNTSIAVLRIGSALAPVQVRTISVPAGPLGETLTPDGRYLLAASGSGAVVNVAAARAGRPAVMGVIPAGLFPREMALEPGGQTLLVTNYASGQLEAVSVATLPAT